VRTAEAEPTESTGEGDGDFIANNTLIALPVSQMKGRCANSLTRLNGESGSRPSTSMYKCKQTEDGHVIISGCTCSHYHLKGHYLTTCPSNLNRSRAIERRGSGRDSVRKRGRPMTRKCSTEEAYDEIVYDTEENNTNGEDWFDVD
jgi:hypothetical protein